MKIKGTVKKDLKTKNLISRLKPGDIALISHKDLDEVAALSLIETKIKCVINLDSTISGRYPNQGPSLLLNKNIPIYEIKNKNIFNQIKDGEIICILNNKIYRNEELVTSCELLDKKKIYNYLNKSLDNLEKELDKFIENTLKYAKKEKELVLGKIQVPKIKTLIKGKHVLVVARGKDYKEDLKAIQTYINEQKPVLIGVDGGGDALLEYGYIPDILIGDMDSVSNKCLMLSKEIIVHAYTNGNAPGLNRIKKLNLKSKIFSCPGISEDIALLLAYCNDADLIVAVGTHSNMIDFLEKGRKGMASTFLVRLKIGSKLVDAKGVNKIYNSNLNLKYIIGLGISALFPIIIICLMSTTIRELIMLIQMRLKFLIGL